MVSRDPSRDSDSHSIASDTSVADSEPKPLVDRDSYRNEGEINIVNSSGGDLGRLKDERYVVPKKERRGLLARFTLIPEFKDPREYQASIKKLIVFIIAFSSVMGPMATSIVFPAINPIVKSLDTTTFMVNVSVGVYSLSLGIFPIWWSSLSELHGRRSVYVISFVMLFAFCIGTSLSPNIESFIVLRVLCGAASASVQSVGAGTVSDLFEPEERGRNLGIYYMGALMAPLVSPIIASGLLTRWSWRSTQWFMVILSGVNVLLLVFLLPETLRTQDSKAAIAAILLERRKENLNRSPCDLKNADMQSNKGDVHGPADLQNITGNGEDEGGEIKRVLTAASSTYKYRPPPDNNIDVGAPQISRIQSLDPRWESKIREYDLDRARTNLQNELARIETEKSRGAGKQGDESMQKQSTEKGLLSFCYVYFIKPMKSVYFLKYPPVLLAIIFSAISFAILYFVNMTIEYDYSRPPYNFKPLFVGLLYIPNSVTYIIASIYGGRWVDTLLKNYKAKYGILAPEARISWNLVTAVAVFPVSLLIFGWCLDKKCHWVAPLVGTALFGFASMMTIGATVSYLVDSLPGRGATGVALNNLIRQILAAVAVFVTEPMLKGMGTGWAFTMLAFIIIGSSTFLLVLKRYGDYWRQNYDLQKLYDQVE
ncbi:hypothetical protein HG536_0C03140 [Torulaspora globosa]|uniref:Major facilitator superfamily (MFS) profile domain-containing protein n=1 Tax=Torulaspora globosa TaxID=48254 RepID=A0A7G3ZF60_9SACH|nr:uncharacterized protein HG536_0C03140 [Torulaspora globosa]QLL32146.1 hypothetical protein HG536_0C03140 [Torulaspora globosa]